MTTRIITPPFQVYYDAAGRPLEGGYIYVGVSGYEARSNPAASYFDSGLTIATGTASGAAVRTMAGYPVYNGAPVDMFVDGDFSITVTDSAGRVVVNKLNQFVESSGSSGVAEFATIADMVASATLTDGQTIIVTSGWQAHQEIFTAQLSGTYATSATVIDCPSSGVQAVSRRREFVDRAELLADTRVPVFFAANPAVDAEQVRFSVIGGGAYPMALSGAGDQAYTTAGGVKLYENTSTDRTNAQTNLALVPGVNVQAFDAQLTDLSTPGAIGVIKVSDGTNYDDITPGTTGQVLTGVTGDKPVFGAVISKQTTNVAGIPSSEFTIPAWATVITIGLRAMNHASVGFVIQLGKPGPTWVTTGYSATLDREGFDTPTTTGLAFGEQSSVGGGTLTLIRDSVPGWYSGGNYKVSTAIVDSIGGYRVNQAGDENIDRIRIITTDGSNWISGIVVFAAI